MATQATKKRRIPEPGSLRQLLTTRSTKSLHPLEWTPESLNLIGWPSPRAILTSLTSAPTKPDPPPFRDSRRDYHVKSVLLTLTRVKHGPLRDQYIRQLFGLLIPRESSAPNLRHDGRHFATIYPSIIVRARSTHRPLFAYVDQSYLTEKRYKKFHQRRDWPTTYEAVQKMNKLPFDPYYASILIAMAQEARYSTSATEFQVHLFTPSRDQVFLTQYSATIPSLYLKNFDNTYKAFSCPLVFTERNLSLEHSEMISEAIQEIEKLCEPLPSGCESPSKRKTMSDIDNLGDQSPTANQEEDEEAKRQRVD